MNLNGQVYLLTGTYSRDYSGSMTYITIYRIDVEKNIISFANIIDGYQIGLNYDITISDFDVLSNGSILINDIARLQLLTVQYTLSNEILLVSQPWVYNLHGT